VVHRPDPTRDVGRCGRALAELVELAPDSVWRIGLDWYPCASDMADQAAGQTGWSGRQVRGVLAALSPMVAWSTQCSGIVPFLMAELAEPGSGRHAGFRGNLVKARRILAEHQRDPLEILRGPKVRAFYRALSGDLDSVTVDRHALAAATSWAGFCPEPTAARVLRVQQAHTVALGRLGRPWLHARELQAVAWLAWRLHKRGRLVGMTAPGGGSYGDLV